MNGVIKVYSAKTVRLDLNCFVNCILFLYTTLSKTHYPKALGGVAIYETN